MKFITHSELETSELGYKIGKCLKKGMTLTLKGDLAGGKTTFTKGIGKALNIKAVINSPTFTILKIYDGDLSLYHIDAYRLDNNEYDLGFDEYMDDGVMVVEWPEFFGMYLPKEYLEISFKYVDDQTREITLHPFGKIYEELLEESKLC